ncbi:GSCOCG00001361001-RA-CDS [Cotesia congregata]|uniref:Mediator of RNA polymerase II transcription subunit 15 n=1 Tax=Cotesia congregata TaxID=51543 RepID=A0A8J2MM20_COTCN|nr:GSCOCG00001361001-RA-CDS [Cotesia congregata]CAG5097137.1 Protein of unknown function [Cotesia congregata]
MANNDDGYWITPLFREGMMIKIDEAQHKSYGATLANSTQETENLIFNQSASKDEYTKFIDLLIMCINSKNFNDITEPCGSLSVSATREFIKNLIIVIDFFDDTQGDTFIENVKAIASSSHQDFSTEVTVNHQNNTSPSNEDQYTEIAETNEINAPISRVSYNSSDDDNFQLFTPEGPQTPANGSRSRESSPSEQEQSQNMRRTDQENIPEDPSTQIEIEEIELIDPGVEGSPGYQENPMNPMEHEHGIMDFMNQKLDSIENTMKLYTDDLGQIIINNVNGNVNVKFDQYKNSLDTVRRDLKRQTKRLERIEKELKLRYLVVYGVPENESNYLQLEKTVLNIINKEVKVSLLPNEVDSIRRFGKDIKKPRPIVLGLTTLRKKMLILRNKKLLKHSSVSIESDFVKNTTEIRRGKDLSLLL